MKRPDVIGDLWVCYDCIAAMANGDFASAKHAARFRAAEAREAPYDWVPEGPHVGEHAPTCERCDGTGEDPYDTDDDDKPIPCRSCKGEGRVDEDEEAGQQAYSTSDCDCCGTSLAGSRHRAALILVGANRPTA